MYEAIYDLIGTITDYDMWGEREEMRGSENFLTPPEVFHIGLSSSCGSYFFVHYYRRSFVIHQWVINHVTALVIADS